MDVRVTRPASARGRSRSQKEVATPGKGNLLEQAINSATAIRSRRSFATRSASKPMKLPIYVFPKTTDATASKFGSSLHCWIKRKPPAAFPSLPKTILRSS